MAVLNPFRALRYDAGKSGKAGPLDRLLTQPYDKISPEMQQRYWASSPYNLAHLIKGETRATDTPADNVYTRAAAKLKSWRADGVLVQRATPAYYVYHQHFTPPGKPDAPVMIRKGLVAMGRVVPYGDGVIYRHEQTLSGPKADRFELLRATRTNLESIFMLYNDPARKLDALVAQALTQPPASDVNDEYGVRHILWDVDDPATVETIRAEMAPKKLIIADGHHRYETALKFGNECTASHPANTELADKDCRLALMTCINMDDYGILVLPTHRVVAGITDWKPDDLLRRAGEYFTIREFPFSGGENRAAALEQLRAAMERAAGKAVRIGAALKGKSAVYALNPRADAPLAALLPELSPAQRTLDVTVLHRLLLERCLGMDAESFQREQHVTYVRDFQEAAASVTVDGEAGAQAAFLLNPVSPAQVAAIALDHRVLPQKSTDFYPKLLSGLAMYPLEH
ncbi:MAG: DUF1015 domain-containing protein [Acidobacteria bacterium]|nr:DUF1015 domain-containing protein [Acidobacteriota bacterium]